MWIGLNAHLMHIGFQVDSCERNKLDSIGLDDSKFG